MNGNMRVAVFVASLAAGCVVHQEKKTDYPVPEPVVGSIDTTYKPAPPPQPERAEITVAEPSAPVESLDAVDIDQFSTVYIDAGSPILVFFMNRKLSDEVREWIDDERIVFTQSDDQNAEGAVVSRQRQQNVSEPRTDAPERWMWAFEEGFQEPFLDAGANVLDRSTIMRLEANDSGKVDNPHATLSAKEIEMEALRGRADIFVELLVTASPTSPYGYDFRAVAKEVETGRILAQASSLKWIDRMETKQKFRTTPQGYERAEVLEVPPLEKASTWLAEDLMKALQRQWE